MRVQGGAAEVIEIVVDGENSNQPELVKAKIKSDNPHFYWHLVDTLYTDKWMAIVRELTANAIDEHDKHGVDRPIRVTAPTAFSPNLVIRDYAKGMSHRMVLDHYMTLADSSKSLDDTQRGGFGLGCKTPFAKTNMFVVESFQNGVMRAYTMMRGRDPNWTGPEDMAPEVPLIMAQDPIDTDEPDGLQITIPVEVRDFLTVTTKIQQVCWRLEPQPETNVELSRPDFLMETPLFRLRRHSYSGDNSAYAVVGNIAYKIDVTALGFDRYSTEYKLLTSPIEIFFEIGEVNPALNREGLSYKPKTIQAIQAKAALILVTLRAEVEKRIAACRNLWEAKITYMSQISEDLRSLMGNKPPEFGGSPLSGGISVRKDDPIFLRLAGRNLERANIDCSSFSRYCEIDPRDPPTLLWLDPALGISSASLSKRLKEWGAGRYASGKSDLLVVEADKETFESFVNDDLYGGMGWIAVNDETMPLPVKVKTPRAPRKKLHKFHERLNKAFHPVEIDLDEAPGFFVRVRSWDLDTEGRPFHGNIDSLQAFCRTFLDARLICVPASFRLKHPQWQNAIDALISLAPNLLADPTINALVVTKELLRDVPGDVARAKILFGADQPNTTTWSRFVEEHNRIFRLSEECDTPYNRRALHLLNCLGLEVPRTLKNTLEAAVDRVTKRYPLLARLTGASHDCPLDDYRKYIRAMK